MSLPALQSLQLETKGFRIVTEARLVRADTFSGVFHVLSHNSDQIFEPPVVIFAPGKWSDENDAHHAAQDYAVQMATDGSLAAAVELRQAACR